MASLEESVRNFGWRDANARPHHHHVLTQIRALIKPSHEVKVLDAGCGNGALTAQIAAAGYDVTGIDPAVDGIDIARRTVPNVRFEVASVYDDLAAIAPPDGWDLIVSSEVIEHLYAPMRFFESAYHALRPGGSLFLTTPYHGYIKNLAISLVGGWDRHWHVEKEGGHIKFFSTSSLHNMLTAAGFRDCRFSYQGRAPFLWKGLMVSARSSDHVVKP